MSLKKLFSDFEDYLPKIDMKIKYEDLKSLDATSKNLIDMKSLLSSMNKIVQTQLKNYLARRNR